MANLKELTLEYLKEKNIKFENLDERAFKVTFVGDNCNAITAFVIFDGGESNCLSVRCFSIGNANFKSKEAAALALCNSLNSGFRWVKFYITEDSDITAEIDAVVEPTTCGEEVLNLIHKIIGIVDSAYPEIMRARFA